MKLCPKCGNRTFYVNAHIVQEWLVDSEGNYLETIEDCTAVTHEADNEDMWTCAFCGHSAPGKDMEIIDPKEIEKTEKSECSSELFGKLVEHIAEFEDDMAYTVLKSLGVTDEMLRKLHLDSIVHDEENYDERGIST